MLAPHRVMALLLLILGLFSLQTEAKIYKYQDETGRWVFSDKKPSSNTDVEEIQYEFKDNRLAKPKLFKTEKNGKYYLIAENPLHAPVEIEVVSEDGSTRFSKVAVAAGLTTLLAQIDPLPKISYRWVVGEPIRAFTPANYHLPFDTNLSYDITQSFNGLFSHSQRPNIYAVDIGMKVGTWLTAARAGTVIAVKQDYHMSGRTQYFLDKANFVMVLHDDGSYATYAHILQSSALVKAGDRVELGDVLAKSGSSGYSTGPHLHFVVRQNVGLQTVSVPFKFIDKQGSAFVPKAGMRVSAK